MGFWLFRFFHHAFFLIEAQRILLHFGVTLIRKRFSIALRFYLRKSAVAGCFHLRNAARCFQFQNNHSAFADVRRLHHDIRSAVSAFAVRQHAVRTDVCQKSCHKSMVEALRVVKITDGLHELRTDKILRRRAVSGFERMQKRTAVGLFHPLVEPVGNGVFVNRLNFRIRNRHGQIQSLAGFVLPLTDFFEIAGEEQEVPKIILRLMNIAVGDILMHRFFNRCG